VAYVRGGSDNWYLNGPRGLRGLGQACDSSSFAAMTPDQQTACGYLDPVTGILTPPTAAASIIPGVSNTILYLGVAVLGLPILMSVFKGGR
jgi:hypothetical protein